jgi:hypothetical protein
MDPTLKENCIKKLMNIEFSKFTDVKLETCLDIYSSLIALFKESEKAKEFHLSLSRIFPLLKTY